MKKRYIAPKSIEYTVCSINMLAESDPTSLNGYEDGEGLVKQNGDNTVSIWDLY